MPTNCCAIRVQTLTASALAAVAILTAGCAANPSAQQPPRRVIVDTDPGTDDALAILLALNSPEVRVEAITVTHGNVPEPTGLQNALRLTTLANRCDIPVAGGAPQPLAQQGITAEFWHGQNGLAEVELPVRCKADARFGPDLIIEMIRKRPHEMTLVPIGPLTNIALAIKKDPGIIPLVKEVVIMGGSTAGGNVTAAAEANIYGDPEAAHAVFAAGWPLTMVGLNVTNFTLFKRPHLQRLSATHGPQNDAAVKMLDFLIGLSERFGLDGTQMHDPLAMGAAIDRSLVRTQDMHVDVETKGEFTRGETVANRYNMVERYAEKDGRLVMTEFAPVPANAKVAVEADAARFIDLFIARLAGR